MEQWQLISFSLTPKRFPSALLPAQDLSNFSSLQKFSLQQIQSALTNIGFIQICSKVPLATFSSLRLCFLRTLELSDFSGWKHRGKWISEWHREVFTERDISGSTRKYLHQMCSQMPPARAGNPTMWPVKATQSEFWRLLMSPQSREIRNLMFM